MMGRARLGDDVREFQSCASQHGEDWLSRMLSPAMLEVEGLVQTGKSNIYIVAHNAR